MTDYDYKLISLIQNLLLQSIFVLNQCCIKLLPDGSNVNNSPLNNKSDKTCSM